METKYGFTKIDPGEFQTWLDSQSISRTCVRVQEHHTWKPRYSDFNGNNHFEMQRGMKRYHINKNGWNDIGQHFSIFPDGIVVTGRPLNKTPACIGLANSEALCIENVGNFDTGGDTMRPEQADAIFSITAALLKKIGVSKPNSVNVVYHHWYNSSGNLVYHNSGQKSCPGTDFFGGNKLADFTANFLPRLEQVMGSGGQLPSGILQWSYVTTDSLNIRSAPRSSASLVDDQGPLAFGSVIRVYEISSNNWFRISQNRQLWVYGRYTGPVRSAIVNTSDTNARLGPGMEYNVDRVFQQGDRVFIVGQHGNWSQITDEQWIHNSLLEFE